MMPTDDGIAAAISQWHLLSMIWIAWLLSSISLTSGFVMKASRFPSFRQCTDCRLSLCEDPPPVVVWKQNGADWTIEASNMASLPLEAQQTWAWCRNFVVPLQLCPWARASVETPTALQIFIVDNNHPETDFSSVVEDAGRRFQKFLNDNRSIESAAIFFVVFPMNDFGDFYDWFLELEENWELMDSVIVAPFHPDWTFEGEAESMQFEKRSPFPTVTLVSTRVVDAAGEAATEQIGKQNEQILLSKTVEELQSLWKQCLRPNVDWE